VTRLHQPSPAEPLIVILIDELAALAHVNERAMRRRIENALGLLLSQDRAVGVTVIGAIQDPPQENPACPRLSRLRPEQPPAGSGSHTRTRCELVEASRHTHPKGIVSLRIAPVCPGGELFTPNTPPYGYALSRSA
jgi:hypothetical protein